jgi:phosphoserine phosphatase RsbU/P
LSIDLDLVLKNQLVERRRRVSSAISATGPDPQLTSLMQQIDAVLERFEAGTYGLCDVCHDSVEAERLIANPLERFCIDHLSQDEQRALEDDLTLAAQIQRGLLPTHPMRVGDWKLDYCYEPARIVSGDYVDILQNGDLYFAIGDVSGKGVAASMLMAKLHTVFRSLIPLQLSVDKLMERASRLFGDSILPGQFATLICGRLTKDGVISLCNAGHPPALLSHNGKVEQIFATGLPLGMFANQKFSTEHLKLETGDTLVLYTDGVPDAVNKHNDEYGMSRLIEIAACWPLEPESLVARCLSDVSAFRAGSPRFDDISIMGIRRA